MVYSNKKRGLEILLGILLVISGSWLIYFGFFVSNEVPEKFRRFFLEDEPPKFIPSCVYIGSGMIYIVCGIYGLRGVAKQFDDFLECFRCISSMLLIVGFSFLLAAYVANFNIIDEIYARLNNTQSFFYTEASYFRNHCVTAWEELQKSVKDLLQCYKRYRMNMRCCGIESYKEWGFTQDHPAMAFIPQSCCRNTSDDICPNQITPDNLENTKFVERFIYVDGCFQSGVGAHLIMLISGLGLVAAVLYCSPFSRKSSYNRFDEE